MKRQFRMFTFEGLRGDIPARKVLELPFSQAREPVEGAILVSRQGPRPGRRTWHNGIDLGGVSIGTPVYPIAPGTVSHVCVNGEDCCGYGNAVLVKHGDDLFSFYAHLDSVTVTVGNVVGDVPIGAIGNTFGDVRAHGCPPLPMVEHLHLEIQHAGFPLEGRDYSSRYDVLQVLASGGLRIASSGRLTRSDPFEYSDPVLAAATEKSVGGSDYGIYQPIVMDEEQRYGSLYSVGTKLLFLGAVVGLVGAAIWVGRR